MMNPPRSDARLLIQHLQQQNTQLAQQLAQQQQVLLRRLAARGWRRSVAGDGPEGVSEFALAVRAVLFAAPRSLGWLWRQARRFRRRWL